MSGAEFGPIFAQLSPEEQAQFLHQQGRNAGIVGSQVLPAWTAALVPWGEDAEGKGGFRWPGLLTGAYAGAGTLGSAGINWLSNKAGYGLNLPTPPGTEAAGQSFSDSARFAERAIPQPVVAQNESEQLLSDAAFGGASMALPIPGAAIRAATAGLPRLITGLTHAVVPHGPIGAAIGTGATVGIEEYENQQRDALIRETGGDPDAVRKLREAATYQGATDLTQPDLTQQVAHPETGAPATVPFPTNSIIAQAAQTATPAAATTGAEPEGKYETLAEFGRPDIKVLTPNFNTTGESNWSVKDTAIAGAIGLVAAPLVMRFGGRVLDPAIKIITRHGDEINTAANVAKFNTNLDRIDAGQKVMQDPGARPGAVRGEAPLPGKAGTVMTNVAQSLYDKTRVLTELSNAIAPNTGVAKEMEARIGTINHSTPLLNAIAEQMATGVNKQNGGKLLPKWKATVQKIDNLDADAVNKLDKGLYSGDELDTRAIKFRAASNAGRPINDDTAFRHNFRNVHSDDLRTFHADMMNDPVTADIANDIYRMQRAHMEHARDMGRLDDTAMNKILKDRPRQIPSTNNEGVIERALGERDITVPGWDTPPTPAVDALTQHYAKLYEELAQNRLTDDLIKAADTWQTASPGRARIVNEMLDPQGKPVPTASVGRPITVYRDGVARTFQIDNTNVHRALQNNAIQTRFILNTADAFRRSYQSGTTGVSGALIAQRPFAFISLNRNIPQIATDRTPGTIFGDIDRKMQQWSGGKFGYRGPDPTQWIGSYHEAGKGVASVTARHMSDALRRDGNPVTKGLKALKGEAWVNAWADKLEQKYLTSNTAQRKAEGATGVAASGVYDRPTFNMSRGNRVGYSPLADVVPGVFHPEGVAIPYTKVRIPGTKGLTSAYINMRGLLRDIHQEISEGGNAYYWKQNPQLSPAQRTFETRRVIGDPSMHGAGSAAQMATHLIPWINPSVQDAVRMMRNLRDNPVSFVLGTVHSLGMAATASLLTAMLGGNKHLNMLGRLMSTHDRASNVMLFHNPDNENDYTQISLPQRWRMLYPLILEGVSEGLGSFALHQGEDTYNRIVHSLADLFNHQISHSTMTAAREGLQDFVGVAQPPPLLQTAAAVTGTQINEPISQIVQNLGEGRHPFDNIVSGDKITQLPGQAAPNTFVSSDDANWVHQVLKSVMGVAADGYMHASNFTHRALLTHDVADAFGGLLTDAGQSWRDKAPFGNMIWGNNVKLSVKNPIEESNRIAWGKMTDPSFPKMSDIGAQGLTRQGGEPIGVSGVPKMNSDPRIIQMVGVVHNYRNIIQNTVEPHIGDIRKQIRVLNEDPYFPAQDKRTQLNILVGKKNELESQKNLLIEKLNASLSQMAGGKHVNVTTFDPQQGMDQFHD